MIENVFITKLLTDIIYKILNIYSSDYIFYIYTLNFKE